MKWKVQMGFTKEELGVLLLAMNSIPSDVEERFVKQGTSPSKLYQKIYQNWEEMESDEYYDRNSQPGLTEDD